MDATTWQTISIVGFSLAAVLLASAIILFFRLRILAVIGDLSGKTAAKQIQEIREQNKRTGDKRHNPGSFNIARGSLTEPVKRTGRTGKTANPTGGISKRLVKDKGLTAQTSSPAAAEILPTEVIHQHEAPVYDFAATNVLGEGTMVLAPNHGPTGETSVLSERTEFLHDGTEVLGQDYGTTVLNETAELANPYEPVIPPAVEFKIVKDIKITHTDEVL
ncbi:hypothetical protein [Neobacillus sp. Marseille-QA0830]